jgi:hypothetical protein
MLRWDDIAMTTVQLDHLRQNFLLFWRGLCSSKEGQGCPFGLRSGRGETLTVTTSTPTEATYVP